MTFSKLPSCNSQNHTLYLKSRLSLGILDLLIFYGLLNRSLIDLGKIHLILSPHKYNEISKLFLTPKYIISNSNSLLRIYLLRRKNGIRVKTQNLSIDTFGDTNKWLFPVHLTSFWRQDREWIPRQSLQKSKENTTLLLLG